MTYVYCRKRVEWLYLNVVMVNLEIIFDLLIKVVPISIVMSTGPLPVSSSTRAGFYAIRECFINFVHSK